ncbi:MAG: hypothetical protein ACLQMT_07675 [Candidatus Acidiferrales bacterium]
MRAIWERVKESVSAAARKPKVRNRALTILAVFLILQIYFVRELLAAELLFGLAFAVLLAFGALFYVVGAIGERGLDWTEAGVRAIAPYARRGYVALEDLSRKSFRNPHPRSESAQ